MLPYNTYVPTVISNALGFALLPLLLSPLVTYLFALWFDMHHHNFGRLAADALFAPLGIIHGLILLFFS